MIMTHLLLTRSECQSDLPITKILAGTLDFLDQVKKSFSTRQRHFRGYTKLYRREADEIKSFEKHMQTGKIANALKIKIR